MEILNLHFPIAGIEFNVLLLIVIGFFVGVLGGFFGIGGGWIVNLILSIFGFNISVANGTALSNGFAISIVGTRKHFQLGNVDWKLAFLSVVGSFIGVEIGAQFVLWLEKYNAAEIVVHIVYIISLSGVGLYMLYDYFIIRKRILSDTTKTENKTRNEIDSEETSNLAKKVQSLKIPPMLSFEISGIYSISLWVVISVFFFSGLIAGLMGFGGGFIILPCLIYVIGCPTIIAVGTSLMSVGLTAAYGTFSYALKGKVDIIASLYMMIGAGIGTQLGVASVKYIRGYGIRILFALLILLAALSVLLKLMDITFHVWIFKFLSSLIIMLSASFVSFVILIKWFLEARKRRF
ncbi:MAG: sulfite exporter TauE/SafE family protein [Ignavibacteria bacterium]|nr:sulfite exporter TauE/SafE family protein [Ignavibacteria bacterium]